MAVGPSRGVWKQLDGLFRFGASGPLGDAELLGRFVAGRRDEAAEDAFAALVERHGPMVLGVCRRVLGDRHAAEDAFQATFLVLARKAGAIARREQLANWLHGVASRTALDARARADRRRARERKASATAAVEVGPDDGPEQLELRAILDEELGRLPASYRGPLILCELDGLSRQVAARRLGIPEGTLSSRLARAKDLLRHRLTRRGLALSAVAIEVLAHEARAVLLSPSLAGSTVQAAARVAAGASLAEAASASVVTLTQGALHAMFLAKIKGLAIGLAAATLVTTGVGVMAQFNPAPAPEAQDDRLGAVEKKLDRILEAMGNPRGDFRGRSVGRPPVTTAAPAAFPGPALSQSPNERLQWAKGRSATAANGEPRPLEARVADLEQRLADIERRFGEMEQRLSNGVKYADPRRADRNAANRSQRGPGGAQPQDPNADARNPGSGQGQQPQGADAGKPNSQQGQQPQGQNSADGQPAGAQGQNSQGQNKADGGQAGAQGQNSQGQNKADGGQAGAQGQPAGSADAQDRDPFRDDNPGSNQANPS